MSMAWFCRSLGYGPAGELYGMIYHAHPNCGYCDISHISKGLRWKSTWMEIDLHGNVIYHMYVGTYIKLLLGLYFHSIHFYYSIREYQLGAF